jgi:hypothetical protein
MAINKRSLTVGSILNMHCPSTFKKVMDCKCTDCKEFRKRYEETQFSRWLEQHVSVIRLHSKDTIWIPPIS